MNYVDNLIKCDVYLLKINAYTLLIVICMVHVYGDNAWIFGKLKHCLWPYDLKKKFKPVNSDVTRFMYHSIVAHIEG